MPHLLAVGIILALTPNPKLINGQPVNRKVFAVIFHLVQPNSELIHVLQRILRLQLHKTEEIREIAAVRESIFVTL